MNQSDVKQIGVHRGIEAATHCVVEDTDRREAHCECRRAPTSDKECVDCLEVAAYEAELNSRCYSPFEVFARDLNADPRRSDGLWRAYEKGVGIGIQAGIRKRLQPRKETKQ